MSNIKNVMDKIEKTREIVDNKYDMSLQNMWEIIRNSKDELDLSSNSFVFGYLQGVKAEKARQEKQNTALEVFKSRLNA